MTDLSIRTSAFTHGKEIPEKFTKDGADVSPELTVGGAPDDAASLALIVDDPDAPNTTFTHWTMWNLPPDTVEIPEDVPTTETVTTLGDASQGRNDFGDVGYGGPRPPEGHGPHGYRFRLIAVDDTLDLSPGAPRRELDDALAGHVMVEDRFTGTFERS
ncbi:YbhB/YbcL family Raf kinase inhibitor-like protein [Haladaptatus sp. CMAA 1911]|uniref:YbhB/YbcL family Raf kinase inhibitor-like protein n=1 Tax=unclassified Haladaptatus TaxID=2622732 RepID=UPI00375444C9